MSARDDRDLWRSSRFDLGRLLHAAEAAAPVEAVAAVALELNDMVAAEQVSFLIADFSGDALIRLGHSSLVGARGVRPPSVWRWPALRRGVRSPGETSRSSPMTMAAWLYAPVTSRGEAVGVLELACRAGRTRRRGAGRAGGPRAGIHRHRQPPLHGPVRMGPALGAAVACRRDPASAAARLLHLRGRAVHPRRVAGTRRRSRRRHVRFLA